MLRRLWGNATPAERSSFLEWVKTAPVEDDEDQFKCNSCEATFADDSEGVSLYECNDCGTRFTQVRRQMATTSARIAISSGARFLIVDVPSAAMANWNNALQ